MKKAIVVLAALALMAGSAYASEWNFYGSARVGTFWSDTDTIPDDTGDVQFSESLHVTSRIGAKVKVSDTLTGRFEYGAYTDVANIRLLYGEWDFGAGKLKVGQDYAPLSWIYSSQAFYDDNCVLAHGSVYSHREPQVTLTFGGLKVGFIKPNTTVNNDLKDGKGTDFTGDIQSLMPAVEVTYRLDLDMVALDFGAGYSTFEADAGGEEENINSYVLAFGFKFNTGGFYCNGDVYYGQNAGNLLKISDDTVPYTENDDGFAEYDTVAGEFLDNECLGFLLVAGYKINDMFKVEAGYGYTETELDHQDGDRAAMYYLNTTITLAPGVFVVPEVGFFDGRDDRDEETRYIGMKWQINF